jgi:hypothetical protein
MYLRIGVDPRDNLRELADKAAHEFHSSCARDASHLLPPASLEFPSEFYFNWFSNLWAGGVEDGTRNSGDRGELIRQPFPLPSRRSVKFATNCYNTPSGLVVALLYRSDLFKSGTMQRIGQDLKWLAGRLIEDSRIPLGSFVLP